MEYPTGARAAEIIIGSSLSAIGIVLFFSGAQAEACMVAFAAGAFIGGVA